MQPADKPSVSKTFVERFNAAAILARDGKFEDSLKAYARIHAPFEDRGEARVMTSEFLGLIELGKAYCLIKLERMQEAKGLFESKSMQTAQTQLPKKTLYEYHYLYGNTLGNLGMVIEMDAVLKRALHVALHDLEDISLCVKTWHWILYWARRHEEWFYLEEQCYAARAFSVKHDNPELRDKALEFSCYAYRGLGKVDKARQCARTVLTQYRARQASPDMLREWDRFLESIDAAGS
jgi:tetratricopeptide (TPR) repeat protein